MTASVREFAERVRQALLLDADDMARRNGVIASDWDEYRRAAGKVVGLRQAADTVSEILKTYYRDEGE
jgi:hypothetical protein